MRYCFRSIIAIGLLITVINSYNTAIFLIGISGFIFENYLIFDNYAVNAKHIKKGNK